MLRIRTLFLLSLILALPATAQDLLLENVTIADPSVAKLKKGQDVLIRDGKIAAIGQLEPTAGATRIDGTGKFLIPGLSDMHVHDIGPSAMPLYVANGVTLVRAMGDAPLQFSAYRDAISKGEMVGPTIRSAGLTFETRGWLMAVKSLGLDFPLDFRIPYSSAWETEEIMQLLDARGSELQIDLIKSRNVPNPAALTALINAANKRQLAVVGHEPPRAFRQALEGMKSIEHLPFFSFAPGGAIAESELPHVIKMAKKNGTFFVPTIVSLHSRREPLDAVKARVAKGDDRDQYISRAAMKLWKTALDAQGMEGDPTDYSKLIAQSFGILQKMAHAGIPLAVGTDVGFVSIYPGFSVHDELEHLVSATKLTPREVLLMATKNGAQLAGVGAVSGSIEVGKHADMVLLDADPFADIRNTRKINAVVLAGRFLDSKQLDALKQNAVTAKDGTMEIDSTFMNTEASTLTDPKRLTELGVFWYAQGNYEKSTAFFLRALELKPSPKTSSHLFLATFNDLHEQTSKATVEQLVARVTPLYDSATVEHQLDLIERITALAAMRKELAATLPLYAKLEQLDPASFSPEARKTWHTTMAAYKTGSDPAAAYRHKVASMPSGWEKVSNELNNIAWWMFENNIELEKAREHAAMGVKLASGSEPERKAAVIDTLAEIRNAQGFPAEAAELAKQAAALVPNEAYLKQLKRFEELARAK